jgi:hypothetical protein
LSPLELDAFEPESPPRREPDDFASPELFDEPPEARAEEPDDFDELGGGLEAEGRRPASSAGLPYDEPEDDGAR